jgi:hypothetical protein
MLMHDEFKSSQIDDPQIIIHFSQPPTLRSSIFIGFGWSIKESRKKLLYD